MTATSDTAEGYAGDLAPREAWDLLARERAAVLVDVRSRPEWSFVGVPDLASISKRPVLVAWQHWTPGPQGAVMAQRRLRRGTRGGRPVARCARRLHLPLGRALARRRHRGDQARLRAGA